MASFKAVMRLFRKFTQATCDHVFGVLYRWLFAQIAVDGLTLDLDSTVMTRYGTQEGAVRGYNPSKRGRASHHPLMALYCGCAPNRQLLAAFPGNSHTANNASAFLDNTFENLGNKRIALLRADSVSVIGPFCRNWSKNSSITSSLCV